jgi:hypothetical protein
MSDFYFILFLKRLDADKKVKYFQLPYRMVSGNKTKLCLKYFCVPIYFVHFFEISLTFISPKPSPKPSDVQLLSTRHVTKVHLLQKFLDPQKHALIEHILPTGGNLSRFSFTWKMCVVHTVYIGKYVSTFVKGKTTRGLQGD